MAAALCEEDAPVREAEPDADLEAEDGVAAGVDTAGDEAAEVGPPRGAVEEPSI